MSNAPPIGNGPSRYKTLHKTLWVIAGVVSVVSIGLVLVPVVFWINFAGIPKESLIKVGIGGLIGVLIGAVIGLALKAVLREKGGRSPPSSS